MSQVMKCSRCRRRYRGSGDWNFTMKAGVAVAVLCPACQTPEENAEAVINESTLVYGVDATKGRPVARAKGEAADFEVLARDLLRRTEEAVRRLAGLVVETGISMSLDDAVQMVEDGLPADYPMPADSGIAGRREMIAQMAQDFFSGDAYED